MARVAANFQPERLYFKDDGIFPNSSLPLVLYRHALPADTNDLATALEKRFAANNWTAAWRNGIYSFPHYHSTTHEVLGVFCGSATLRLGGEKAGSTVNVCAGDVIVIPAGVARQKLEASKDFRVVGAYADGRRWDLLRGAPDERPRADRNIADVPLPQNDPLYGADGPLRSNWSCNGVSAK